MKEKIIVFIIGALVGAVITASGFLVYEKLNTNTNQIPSIEGMEMKERPDGETPPEKPSDSKDNKNSSDSKDNENNNSKQKSSTKKDSSNNTTNTTNNKEE